MIYSEKLVWEAVYRFIPSFRVVRNRDINLNLPSSVKSAAVTAFIEDGAVNCVDTLLYEDILRATLNELNDPGWMTFGHVQTIEQLKRELIQ